MYAARHRRGRPPPGVALRARRRPSWRAAPPWTARRRPPHRDLAGLVAGAVVPRRREARAPGPDPAPAGPRHPAARGRRARRAWPPRVAGPGLGPPRPRRPPRPHRVRRRADPRRGRRRARAHPIATTSRCSARSCCRRSLCCTAGGWRTSTSSRRTSSCATVGRSSSTSAPHAGWAAGSRRDGRSAPSATRRRRWRPASRCPRRWTCSGSARSSPRRSPASRSPTVRRSPALGSAGSRDGCSTTTRPREDPFATYSWSSRGPAAPVAPGPPWLDARTAPVRAG